MTVQLLLLFLGIIDLTSSNCNIDVDTDLTENSPILIKNEELLNSQSTSQITLKNSESFEILCSGNNNWITSTDKQTLATVTCNNYNLEIARNRINIREVLCRKQPESTARHVGKCNANGKLIEIGVEVQKYNRFIQTIVLCFNEENSQTYWTKNFLKSTGHYWKQKAYKRFENDFFTNVDPYVAYKENRHLDKGHLSAKGDFYTSFEKRSTYYYLNIAPQVKKFNNENWRKLEELIREVAHGNHMDFTVYTGTHGAVSFLKNGQIPLPLYFWKVIIDVSKGNGVAFIGTNDINEVYPPLCNDICSRLSWMGGFEEDRKNWRLGFVYCCSIESFKSISGMQIPEFSEYNNKVMYNL